MQRRGSFNIYVFLLNQLNVFRVIHLWTNLLDNILKMASLTHTLVMCELVKTHISLFRISSQIYMYAKIDAHYNIFYTNERLEIISVHTKEVVEVKLKSIHTKRYDADVKEIYVLLGNEL